MNSAVQNQAGAQLVKHDPETLAIRTRPPRAIRLRRGVIIMIVAIGSASLIAVTWLAFKPRFVARLQASHALAQPDMRPPTQSLADAPATYGDIPSLGPPLPGDLGKPIIEHQQSMIMAGDTPSEQSRQAQADRLKAARQSSVLAKLSARAASSRAPQSLKSTTDAIAADSIAAPQTQLSLDSVNDPNAQAHKVAFVRANDHSGDVNSHMLQPLLSPYTLSAGSVIAASLVTGVRSDLPGLVVAQVTQNTYDSATGRILLIPQGARLIGSYDSVIAHGQKRALIVWQRIVMPDGSSLKIDNTPASDASGYSGLADKVDLHTWQMLKGVVLSTLLGVGPQLALSGEGDLIRAIRLSTQDNAARAGDQLTRASLGIQPTITIRPGTPVFLVVRQDLIIAPVEKQ